MIAHSTNLGVAAISSSIEGMTADQLQHTSQWFLRETTLKAASLPSGRKRRAPTRPRSTAARRL
jgi:hypothetical protein